MREVKFRAWSEYSNKLVVWEHMKADDTLGSVLNGDDKKIHVMQYTGLKDKNGHDIYEGDIVNFVDFDTTGGHREDRQFTGVIKYQSGLYEIWNNNFSEFFESDGAFILNHAWLQDDEFEVIGNIYENPGLLAGENL